MSFSPKSGAVSMRRTATNTRSDAQVRFFAFASLGRVESGSVVQDATLESTSQLLITTECIH